MRPEGFINLYMAAQRQVETPSMHLPVEYISGIAEHLLYCNVAHIVMALCYVLSNAICRELKMNPQNEHDSVPEVKGLPVQVPWYYGT